MARILTRNRRLPDKVLSVLLAGVLAVSFVPSAWAQEGETVPLEGTSGSDGQADGQGLRAFTIASGDNAVDGTYGELTGSGFVLGDPIANSTVSAQSQGGANAHSDDKTGTIAAQAVAASSGLHAQDKPTLAELRALYHSLPSRPSLSDGIWVKAPSVNSYTAGSLNAPSTAFSEAYINLIRRSAHLDSVALTDELNDNAAQGALILARLDNGLTHFPDTPSGVTDARAAAGKFACAHSNISYSWGYSDPLQVAIQGQMDDEDSGNMARLGHRRWLLNPETSTMGIGAARANSGAAFTVVRVFGQDSDYGSVVDGGDTDYDFISWPASGPFLSDLFAPGTPWSITLNPDRYATPSFSAVKVRLVRQSDGKAWTLDSADSKITTTGEYFNVDTGGYGVSNCIIFNPGSANLGASVYKGLYTVEVTGVQTVEGEETTLRYDVAFDSAYINLASVGASISGLKAKTYTGKAQTQSPTVKVGGKTLKAGTDYTVSYKDNRKAGTATVTVTGKGAYAGSKTATFKITKAANPMKAKAKAKTVKYTKAKKKAQVVSGGIAFSKKAQGKVTYAKVAKGSSKYLTVNKSNGKITVKKGTPKGTYKIKVKATAKGNANYKAKSQIVTVTVKVK